MVQARLFLTNFRPVKLQEHVCLAGAVFTCGHTAPTSKRGHETAATDNEPKPGKDAAPTCSRCAAMLSGFNANKRHKAADGVPTARPAFQTGAAVADTGRRAGLRWQLEASGCPQAVLDGQLCSQGWHYDRLLLGATASHGGKFAERTALALALEVMHVWPTDSCKAVCCHAHVCVHLAICGCLVNGSNASGMELSCLVGCEVHACCYTLCRTASSHSVKCCCHSLQEAGGCLIFCTTRRQCKSHAMALTQLINRRSAELISSQQREPRLQMAMDLLNTQGGSILSPLRELLLSCCGVAYHHAGAPCRSVQCTLSVQ